MGGFYHKGTRLRGITRGLDRAFAQPKTACGRKGAALRRRAIATGNKVDAQLTRFAKDPKTRLCPAAKVRGLYLFLHLPRVSPLCFRFYSFSPIYFYVPARI